MDKCDHREYGFAHLHITKMGPGHESADQLFDGLEELEVKEQFLEQTIPDDVDIW